MAMACSDSEGLPHTTNTNEEDDVDLPGFLMPKRKTLLESSKHPPLTVQNLISFVDVGEDPNQIEETQAGLAPIHYIVIKPHENKQQLLVTIVIHGNADVDLTTTMNSRTALHLATKIGDSLSVKTLISLGADVNKCDEFGHTPLDFASLSQNHPPTETEVAMVSLHHGDSITVLGKPVKAAVHDLTPIASKQSTKESEVITLLKTVGGTRGKQQKNLLSCSTNPVREGVRPPLRDLDNILVGNPARINCEYFYEVEQDISRMLKDTTKLPTSEQAIKIVKLLKEKEEYKQRCGSRILCLDGGGIRGLIQLAILQDIERKTGKKITDLFDWIVGTSTGGIIALALVYCGEESLPANQKSISEVRNIYWQQKDQIFKKRADGLLGKGNTSNFESILKKLLGEYVTLNEISRPNLLIPAVQKQDTHLKLHFFNNCFGDDFGKENVWKVARYTSAAPPYFSEMENYVDGGMLANNPAADALTKIQDHYRQRSQKLPISLLVSIGSGINPPQTLGPINIHKNYLDPKVWVDFFDVLESAVLNKSTHVNCQCRCQEQGIKYFRFDPTLDEKVDSDEKDSKKLMNMLYKTRSYIHSEKNNIDDLISELKQSDLTYA